MTTYKITTRDTDGGSSRKFKTLAGAMKRFEEMAGHSLEAAIREQFHAASVLPTVRAAACVHTVSNYGTVVVFTRDGDAEPEPVVAADPEAPVASITEQIAALRQDIDDCEESIAEREGQYHSECAMFGDAGFGQHPSCWKPEALANLAKAKADLAALYDTPEGRVKAAAEADAMQRYMNGEFDIPF